MNDRQNKLTLATRSTCSSFGLKALGLALVLSSVVSTVGANHIPNFDKHTSIMAREQPITEFFDELFGGLGLAVKVDESVGGSINGDFRGAASEIYRGVGKAFQLTMYYDGSTVYIYSANQVSRKIIPMDQKLGERVIDNAKKMHIGDQANRAVWSDMGLVVVGTDRYQRQIETYVDAIVAQSTIDAGQSQDADRSVAESKTLSDLPKAQIAVPQVAVAVPQIDGSKVAKPKVKVAKPKVIAAPKVDQSKVATAQTFGKSFRDTPIAEKRQFERVFPIAPRFSNDALVQKVDTSQPASVPVTIVQVAPKPIATPTPTPTATEVVAVGVHDDWKAVPTILNTQANQPITKVEAYEFSEPVEVVVQSKSLERRNEFQAVKVAESVEIVESLHVAEIETPTKVGAQGNKDGWVELTNPGLVARPLEPVKVKQKVHTPSSSDWTEISW